MYMSLDKLGGNVDLLHKLVAHSVGVCYFINLSQSIEAGYQSSLTIMVCEPLLQTKDSHFKGLFLKRLIYTKMNDVIRDSGTTFCGPLLQLSAH